MAEKDRGRSQGVDGRRYKRKAEKKEQQLSELQTEKSQFYRCDSICVCWVVCPLPSHIITWFARLNFNKIVLIQLLLSLLACLGFFLCFQVTVTTIGNGCVKRFPGTSSAAPIAAGIVALVLEVK